MSSKDLSYYLGLDYKINIERIEQEDEFSYIAYSIDLGKYACYGKGNTQIEATQAFLEEKNNFLEYLFNSGESIPEPKREESERFSGFFNVRTSPIIHANLVAQAKELEISLNLYLNQILSGATKKKISDSIILDKIGELCGKLDTHHYEVTRQLRYQHDTITSQYKWLAEYSNQYLEVA